MDKLDARSFRKFKYKMATIREENRAELNYQPIQWKKINQMEQTLMLNAIFLFARLKELGVKKEKLDAKKIK